LVPFEHLQFLGWSIGPSNHFVKYQDWNLHHLIDLPYIHILSYGGISTTLKTKIAYHSIPQWKRLVFYQ
jgi:hypothetical protein